MMKTILLFLLSSSLIVAEAGAQTVNGKIYYDIGNNTHKPGSNLIVYLIPNIPANQNIIATAAAPGTGCLPQLYRSARNYKMAITDRDGLYYFDNVNPGNYLLKVCTPNGGYYTFQIRAQFRGTLPLPDFPAITPLQRTTIIRSPMIKGGK